MEYRCCSQVVVRLKIFPGVEVPASTTSQFATSPGDDTELSRAALLLRSRTMCLGSDSEVFAGHLLGAVFIISMGTYGNGIEWMGWVQSFYRDPVVI